MSALKYWLWLTELPGLTNQTRLALLRHFPTPEDVYYADPEEVLLTEGITREQAKLLEDKDCSNADRILADCQRLDADILTIQDAGYPNRLRNIYDPPCLLYVRGRLPAFDDEASIAVVGTRKCSPYGVACAEKLAFGLAAAGAVVLWREWRAYQYAKAHKDDPDTWTREDALPEDTDTDADADADRGGDGT